MIRDAKGNLSTRARGACLCGRVRFEVRFPSLWVAHCHCSMCRRAHGAGYVTWLSVPSDRFTLVEGDAALRRFASSHEATRSFCGACGSTLLFESSRWAGEVHVAMANLLDPPDRAPQAHAFYTDRAPWVTVHDGLPLRGGVTGVEPLSEEP